MRLLCTDKDVTHVSALGIKSTGEVLKRASEMLYLEEEKMLNARKVLNLAK